ncbi:MAG: sensor histidine kinase [Flavobacteriaceae bacterium]
MIYISLTDTSITSELVAYLALFLGLFFGISYALLHYRIRKFVSKEVESIYSNLLPSGYSYQRDAMNSDIETLQKNVQQYASDSQLEIERLKVREDYRREFIGNISHELKTPLFTVQGYILTLLDGGIKDKKIRQKYLRRSAKGVERLIYIVKDMDLITKFEAGIQTIDRSNFNLIEVIQNVFDLFEMEAAKNEIKLNFDRLYLQPIWVNADKERIQQVLTNLVINSLKYGQQKGITEISISDFEESKILVRVVDNGEGIDKEDIPRLFERFYRVDRTRSRAGGGSGLGLSIVKHIIEAHQEQIFVESELGVGSEFSFTLPKAEIQDELVVEAS